MMGLNGHHEPETPPEGALILTESLLVATSKRWVKLPFLTLRLSRMPTEEMLQSGWIAAPTEGTDEEKKAALEARAQGLRTHGVWVEIGVVGASEALAYNPTIPGSENWPTDPLERNKIFNEWRAGLSLEERQRYDSLLVTAHYGFISAGLLTPRVTPEQCKAFKDDALFLAAEIQRLSGFTTSPAVTPTEPKTSAPASAPSESAPA